MIEIMINEVKQDLSEINPSWIYEQIKARENQGVAVCVKIFIKYSGVDIALSCGNCGPSAGGGRIPNSEEQRVLSIWDKFDLNSTSINVGKLTAFLKQIEKS